MRLQTTLGNGMDKPGDLLCVKASAAVLFVQRKTPSIWAGFVFKIPWLSARLLESFDVGFRGWCDFMELG